MFHVNIDFYETYDRLWALNDPRDPGTWENTRRYKTIYPLKGTNVDIVPIETKGYLMDSTCDVRLWNGNAYSFTPIYVHHYPKRVRINASVYCYVSNDFDGDHVALLAQKNNAPDVTCYYDLSNKSTWQRLYFVIEDDKPFYVYAFFCKYGETSFSKLKGHVIFAYPECNKVEIDTIINQKINFKESSAFISFAETFYKVDTFFIGNKLKNFISQDTIYYPFKANLNTNFPEDKFGEDRISRWQFAVEIWEKEYSWSQKIFGGGFNFLNWYGFVFLKDKTKTDYPHNPFLHILLYSGILGVLLYIFLLYKVFYYYIKYIKEYYLFFIFFLITYFFTFFSGGNPFDPPIMGFFMILPFFIHYIHDKDKPNDNKPGFKLRVKRFLLRIQNFRTNN